MEELISQARELGKKIGVHPRAAAFKSAAKAVAADRDAQDVLRAYQEHAGKIAELEAHGKPIEPADKRKLAETQGKVAANDKLKALMKAQADYMELMSRVNHAMELGIEGDEK